MSRLVLIRPPTVFAASSFSAPVTMPQALAYLSANLIEHGHEVQCIDALGEGINHIGVSYSPRVRYRGLSNADIVARVEGNPDAIGVSAMFTQDWPHIASMLGALRECFPDIPIIVGGEHPSALPEYTLRGCSAVTYVAVGEGEQTIVDFADFLDSKLSIDDVSGIRYLTADDRVHINANRPRLLSPDELPWPAWELFDLEPFFAVGEGHGVERTRSMPLLATRGCPYQCTFCSSPLMWTTRYVMRDVGRVVDEIVRYLGHYSADNIDFYDLTAIIKKKWIVEFCQEIKRRGLDFSWQLPSGTRSEALDEEVLGLMAETGCRNVTYAPESGSMRTLVDIKKKIKLPRLFQSIRHAKARGIFVKCNLIIGFPKERRADILKTVWAAIRFAIVGVDDAGLYVFSPYPGSELFEDLRRSGRIGELDQAYFESLMSFMGVGESNSYCASVGARELAFYRVAGMAMFYSLSYLLHPSRILRSIRNWRSQRSDTVFEQRFFALLRRWKLEKLRVDTLRSAGESTPASGAEQATGGRGTSVERELARSRM